MPLSSNETTSGRPSARDPQHGTVPEPLTEDQLMHLLEKQAEQLPPPIPPLESPSLSDVPSVGTPFERAFAASVRAEESGVPRSATSPSVPTPFEEAFAVALDQLKAETTETDEYRSPMMAELLTPPPIPQDVPPIALQDHEVKPEKVPLRRLSSPPPLVSPASPLTRAPEVTLRNPPSFDSPRPELSPLQIAACSVFRKEFDEFFGICETRPHGLADRVLHLDRRGDAQRFQEFLRDSGGLPDQPEVIAGIVAFGNLLLATQQKPMKLFRRPNPERRQALAEGLREIRHLDAMFSGAVTFSALGPDVQARLARVTDQILDFLRYCLREKFDPKAPESVQLYSEAASKRRFATAAGDVLPDSSSPPR